MKKKIKFVKKTSKKRLQVVLAHAGVASRRSAEKIIAEGRVAVDGKIVREQGFQVDPTRQKIKVDDRLVGIEEIKHYYLFNKPKGVTSTVKDELGRKKVTDFFKGIKARLYPIGRLDRDSTGLLLLTNDGGLAFKLSHPKSNIEKEYIASLDDKISPRDIRRLELGVVLDGRRTAKCKISPVSKSRDSNIYKIIMHEGKNRQIRRMFAIVNRKVKKLVRTRYSFLRLDNVKEGKFRKLSYQEVEKLKRVISTGC